MLAYIVASTLSIVRPPWICFIAADALFIASRVSLLILAVSMLLISRSRVSICADVCSSWCSSVFFFRNAFFAATTYIAPLACVHRELVAVIQ